MSEKNTDNEIKNDVDIQDEDSIEVASEDADINTEDIEESEELTDSEENNDLEEDNVKKQITRETILEQIYDEDSGYKKKDVIKEKKERTPFKALGIFSLIIAIAGIALIGVLAYFIILNPYYIKSGASDEPLIYPELATGSDASEKSELLVPNQATQTDVDLDTATDTDALE